MGVGVCVGDGGVAVGVCVGLGELAGAVVLEGSLYSAEADEPAEAEVGAGSAVPAGATAVSAGSPVAEVVVCGVRTCGSKAVTDV